MIANGNIKKIMYMGKEISEARNTDRTVWVKKIVTPPPPPKPCTSHYQCHQCGDCERSNQCSCQKSGQNCSQHCGNCLYNCQYSNQNSNQTSDM